MNIRLRRTSVILDIRGQRSIHLTPHEIAQLKAALDQWDTEFALAPPNWTAMREDVFDSLHILGPSTIRDLADDTGRRAGAIRSCLQHARRHGLVSFSGGALKKLGTWSLTADGLNFLNRNKRS